MPNPRLVKQRCSLRGNVSLIETALKLKGSGAVVDGGDGGRPR